MSAPERPTRSHLIALALLVLAGLAIRGLAIRSIPAPYPADAAYYLHVAQNLEAGRGLVTDYAWVYARGVPEALPAPAFGYWNPGMSLYLWPWLKLTGPTYLSAQLANVFLFIPFALLVWHVGRQIAGNDVAALIGVALACVEPHIVVWSATADATMLHATLVAGGMVAMVHGLRGSPRWLWLAGLLTGCAYLVRNDGALLVPVFGVCAVVAWRRKWSTLKVGHVVAFLVPCAAVVLPWLVRNQLLFGSVSPPHQSVLLHLPRYADIFRSDWSTITRAEWLQARGGWGGALVHDLGMTGRMLKWTGLGALNVFGLLAAPLICVRRPAIALPFVSAFLLLAVAYAFVLPEVGGQGAFVRSFPCLYPLVLGAAGAAVCSLSIWLAARLGGRGAPLLVLGLTSILLVHAGGRTVRWAASRTVEVVERPNNANEAELASFFSERADSGALSDDPWALHRITGRRCATAPTDGVEAMLRVAKGLDLHYLLVRGAGIGHYPGLQQALQSGRFAVVRDLPTSPAHQGLLIIDLQAEELDTEARRLNADGQAAAERHDYARAVALFEQAHEMMRDYDKPREALTDNLVRATMDWSAQCEQAGDIAGARELRKKADDRRHAEGNR